MRQNGSRSSSLTSHQKPTTSIEESNNKETLKTGRTRKKHLASLTTMMETEEGTVEDAPEAARDVEDLGGGNAKRVEAAKRSPIFCSRKKVILIIAILALVAVLVTIPTVLRTDDSSSGTQDDSSSEMPDPSAADIPDGIWTSRAFGYVIDVANGEMTLMEETDISCIAIGYGPLADSLSESLGGVSDIKVDGDVTTCTFEGADPLIPIVFDKVDASQGACAKGLTLVKGNDGYVRDPLLDFDVLAKTFDEQYAFFGLRGINWTRLTTAARMNLTLNSTDDELIEAFKSILLPLDDGHVNVGSDNLTLSSKQNPFIAQLEDEFEQQEDMNISDFEEYFEVQISTWGQILETYMDGGFNYEPGGLIWGRFNGTGKPVGYIFFGHFEFEDEDTFVAELNEVFSSLADTESIVFDIRLNGGGYSSCALLIASHFVSERTLAFTKSAFDGDDFTDKFEIYVEPGSGPTYDGRVILIISGATASAGEIFPMTMAQLPQTILLGRNTSGTTSESYPRRLPNGWLFDLPSVQYETPDGISYEAVGIPPKILPDADLLPLSEREAFRDSWLEEALETARQ